MRLGRAHVFHQFPSFFERELGLHLLLVSGEQDPIRVLLGLVAFMNSGHGFDIMDSLRRAGMRIGRTAAVILRSGGGAGLLLTSGDGSRPGFQAFATAAVGFGCFLDRI